MKKLDILTCALIIPLIISACSHSPEGNRTPKEEADLQPEQQATGACNAQGNNNNIDCEINLPVEFESLAGIIFQWSGGSSGKVLFTGAPTDLPTPPNYDPYESGMNHCGEWEEWFQETPEIYRYNSGIEVLATSSEQEQVSITNVELQVFSKKEIPEDSTTIQCSFPAGGSAGYSITVSTKGEDTILSSSELGLDPEDQEIPPAPMPPASISLGAGEDNFTAVEISIESTSGFLYEGKLVVETVINGELENFEFGSPESPLKWVGDGLNYPVDTVYDWNPEVGEWEEVFF